MQLRKIKYILTELKDHAPFTVLGAILGVVFMFLFKDSLRGDTSRNLFNIFHPAHVVLSAIATAAMFKRHTHKCNMITLVAIGWIGAIGVATLSDSVIPYVGEVILELPGLQAHDHGAPSDTSPESHHDQHQNHEHHSSEHAHPEGHCRHNLHIGFIEQWYIVNPAALLGILIAIFWPHSKFPHFGHVLLSIWASLFHVLMALGENISTAQWIGISVFLFIAVWLPCCISDIVFPLLFVKPGENLPKHVH